ncbi:MAG TPA: hypothetical protein VNL94_05045 [Candidatus Binatia bacterium]|nr:hypothetical protein [Candidatus Binatia bacterium]
MTISGHVPPREADETNERPQSEAPEHEWSAAAPHVFPALRPPGTHGVKLASLDLATLQLEGTKQHALALTDPGPADLVVVYVLRGAAYDVVINADHLLTWGIAPEVLRGTAIANLRAWSAGAPWTEEKADGRHLLSSDTGAGGDAARILLDEVRHHIAGECGGPARILIALPDRDLLVAGSLNPGDGEFATQFANFIAEVAEDAHEPIDRRVFELVGDAHELVPFVA